MVSGAPCERVASISKESLHMIIQHRLSTSGNFLLCDGCMHGFPIRYASQGFANLFGYSSGECLGKKCGDLVGKSAVLIKDPGYAKVTEASGLTSSQVALAIEHQTSRVAKKVKQIASHSVPDSGTTFDQLLNVDKNGNLLVIELIMFKQRLPGVGWPYIVSMQTDVTSEVSIKQLLRAELRNEHDQLAESRTVIVCERLAHLGTNTWEVERYLHEKALDVWRSLLNTPLKNEEVPPKQLTTLHITPPLNVRHTFIDGVRDDDTTAVGASQRSSSTPRKPIAETDDAEADQTMPIPMVQWLKACRIKWAPASSAQSEPNISRREHHSLKDGAASSPGKIDTTKTNKSSTEKQMSAKKHDLPTLEPLAEAGITPGLFNESSLAAEVGGDKASNDDPAKLPVCSSGTAPGGVLRCSFRVPEEFAAEFGGMGAIVLKGGEARLCAKVMVDILYSAIGSTPRTKLHPQWTPNSNGKNHVVFVPDEDMGSLQAMYATDEFQQRRRQWEKMHSRRAPRLCFHKGSESPSSQALKPRVIPKQENGPTPSIDQTRLRSSMIWQ